MSAGFVAVAPDGRGVEGVANWRNNVERHVAEAMKLNEAPREALDKAQAEVDQELAGYRASR
jgi:hypothetical protein